jgi:hypothetical protein
MRRALAPLLLAAIAAVASACSGPDAQEAQALLAQSEAAFAELGSATFAMTITASAEGQEFKMTANGGGYVRGKHAGDAYMVATATNMPFRELEVVKRSGRVTMTVDGASVGLQTPTGTGNPVQLVDYARYVKDVRVEHGKLIDGEPMTKVVGVLDTAGLVNGALAGLSGGGASGLDFSDAFGDTRLVLYVSDVTHLPMRGLVDLPMSFGGHKAEMHLDFAYTSFNEKLEFPGLA